MFYPKIFDYSTGPPSATSIAQQGIGVVRYLPRQGGDGSVLPITAPEYLRLHDAGVQVALVCEQHSARNPIDTGYNGGVSDAQWFRNQAISKGFPVRSLYAAYDYNDTSQYAINQSILYAEGWKSVLGDAADAYGFMGTLQALHSQNLFTRSWLAGAQPVQFPDFVNLYQWNNGRAYIDGIECDINYQLKPDWGQIEFNPAIPQEEIEPMLCKASLTENVIPIPTYGKPNFYIQNSYGNAVTIIELTWIGPTPIAPAPAADYLGQEKNWTFHADRPGPIPVPAGAVAVTLKYTSHTDFAAWCA